MVGPNEKILIDIGELSALTGISGGTLYHWAAAGKLPCVRLSARCLRFRLEDVHNWIDSLMEPVKHDSDESFLRCQQIRRWESGARKERGNK